VCEGTRVRMEDEDAKQRRLRSREEEITRTLCALASAATLHSPRSPSSPSCCLLFLQPQVQLRQVEEERDDLKVRACGTSSAHYTAACDAVRVGGV
jgi:hypothetical protein